MHPWQYVVLAGLGAFHGLNPGMGWLLALAGGVRERRRAAIAAALGPIALGHAASVFVIATLVAALMSVTGARLVATAGGVALTAFGVWRLVSRSHHRAGPRPADLLTWSFLMSSAHGAGLVLLPLLAAVPAAAHHGHAVGAAGRTSAMTGILATTVHTAAMVAAAGLVALVAYEVLRLRPVRVRARLDVDRVWAFALAGSGVATLALTLRGG
ncbi:hypothetical protein [Dactylosporangium sp. NPDC000521]|uniref:hypothetical protein n=1 Tax=Dactylosporangium sp. NPDC000521 TaxID=3363975 RepID=UPI003686BC28